MGLSLNPANWMITDTLQGQPGGFTNPLAGTSGAISQLGGIGGSNLGSFSNLSVPASDPQVLGATSGAVEGAVTVGTDGSPMHYVNGQWVPMDVSGYGASNTGSNTDPNPYNTQQQSFLNGISGALGNIHQGGRDAFTNAGNNLQNSANGILSSFSTGQQNIDQGRQNNELGRMNATQDLLGYIRSGLRQGGSRIASMNAGDSSAPDALARAYNQVGAQRQRGINNQAGVVGRNIDIQQNQQKKGLQDQLQSFNLTRDNFVNNISQSVRNSLAALNQQAAGLSLPDQLNVEQQKQQIIDEGMGQLQSIDNWLQQQTSAISPMDAEQVTLGARQLQQAGSASPNQFAVNPINQQMIQGPQVDQLPLFSARKLNKNQ